MPERLVLPELEEIQPFLSVSSCVTLPPCQGHQMTGLYPFEVVRSTSCQKILYNMLTVHRGCDCVWTGHIVVNISQSFRGFELCFMWGLAESEHICLQFDYHCWLELFRNHRGLMIDHWHWQDRRQLFFHAARWQKEIIWSFTVKHQNSKEIFL